MDVKKQIVERVAITWEASSDEIIYRDGGVHHLSKPELSLTITDVAKDANQTGGPIVGRANVTSTGAARAYAAMIVDVSVDPETGKTTILRCTAFQDAGKAIHPSYVEGQIQGGAVQGIGWALNEEYFMSGDGHMVNATLLDYRMPVANDLPMIEPVIVEVPNPGHPYGVRGVGEAGIVPPLAAVANAVSRAIGVRMMDLPMSPGAVSGKIMSPAEV